MQTCNGKRSRKRRLRTSGRRKAAAAEMNIDLTDEEAAALLRELNNIIKNDRSPLSPRVRSLRDVRAKPPGAPASPPPLRLPRTGRPRP